MSDPFSPTQWYWVVAGSATHVYSSAAAAYVVVADATYVAWLGRGNLPTAIATEAALWTYLAAAWPPGIALTNAAGQQAIRDASPAGLFATLRYASAIDASTVGFTNVNDIVVPGFYVTSVATNSPTSDTAPYYLEVSALTPSGTDYIVQRASKAQTGDTYIRVKWAGAWTAWRQIIEGVPTTNKVTFPGDVAIPSTTGSSSHTTGALVVGGGIGAAGIYVSGPSGFSGGVGSCGTATQAGSITATITANFMCGHVVTVSSTLAAAAEATFGISNYFVAANDVMIVWIKAYAGAGNPNAWVSGVAGGGFNITLTNEGSAALNAAVTIGFAILKGAIT